MLLVIGAISVPIALNYLLFSWSAPGVVGDSNSWLGFLANYSGGILGGIVAYIVAKIQIDAQKIADKKKEYLGQLPTLVKVQIELDKFINAIEDVNMKKYPKEKFETNTHYLAPYLKMDDANWSGLELIVDPKLLSNLVRIRNKYALFVDAISYDLNKSYVLIEEAKIQKLMLEKKKLGQRLTDLEELDISRYNGIFYRNYWENIQAKQMKASYWNELTDGTLKQIIENGLREVNLLINEIEKDK